MKGIQAAYFTSLSFVDSRIGRLIEALDQTGLSEQTLVVYVGDNGYMLGQHGRFEKHCFFEQAVRIPMIMRWPGHVESGRARHGPGRDGRRHADGASSDALAGASGSPGAGPLPLLESKPGARAHDVVFSEYLENEEAMVRSARYKLIVCTGRRLREDGYRTARALAAARVRTCGCTT